MRVLQAKSEQLDAWSVRVLTAATVEEVFASDERH